MKNFLEKATDLNMVVTRDQALDCLKEFVEQRLDQFGPYEDAIAIGEPIVFHSHLSMSLNNGLLLPGEICDMDQKNAE